jgi:hypothetical protein
MLYICYLFRPQIYKKEIIQTNNSAKNEIIQRNNSPKFEKIQRNNSKPTGVAAVGVVFILYD